MSCDLILLVSRRLLRVLLLSLWVAPLAAVAADPQRQAEVARRGPDVMPFSLQATRHVFTKTGDGGTQRVVAKRAADMQQVTLVRGHLRAIQNDFSKGNFSGPSHLHGDAMAGLADLKAAKPGQVTIDYKDVAGGAELTYRTADPKLVAALHEWFDAQLSDHGTDAMEGHAHDGPAPKPKR